MSLRRFRRKVRCVLKHGPRGCPHIERHTRRPKRRTLPDPPPSAPTVVPPLAPQAGKHVRS